MPGATISNKEISVLQASIDSGKAPKEALIVLSEPEYNAYVEGRAIEEVIAPLRKRIFEGSALPENFPLEPFSFENFFGIAILCENLGAVEAIKTWMVKTMAEHHGTSAQNISRQVEFKDRTWFDGPISISIIEDTRKGAGLL